MEKTKSNKLFACMRSTCLVLQRLRMASVLVAVITIISIQAAMALLMMRNHHQDITTMLAMERKEVRSTTTGGETTFINCCGLEQKSDRTDDEAYFVETSTVPSFQMSIHDPSKDEFVSGGIAKTGCWECHIIGMVQQELNKSNPSAFFLDIGGNIGMYSLTVAAMGKQAYILEPFPENFKRICQSVVKNDMCTEAHLLPLAATSKDTTINLSVFEKGNLGSVKISSDGGGDSLPSVKQRLNQIEGVPIDSLRHLFPESPVAIKMDIEGAECDALAGALEFLREHDVLVFVMELRPPVLRKCFVMEEVKNILCDKGLKPFRIEQDGTLLPLNAGGWKRWKHQKHPQVRYFDVIWKRE